MKFEEYVETDWGEWVSSIKMSLPNQVQDYILMDCPDDEVKNISLERFARAAGISGTYLSQLMLNYFGPLRSFHKILLQRKMMLTIELLLDEPKLTIKEIALEVGYNDVNYFTRIFKKRYNITPYQFRLKMSRGLNVPRHVARLIPKIHQAINYEIKCETNADLIEAVTVHSGGKKPKKMNHRFSNYK